MSYDIIRGLKIDKKNQIVTITAACSNLYPKTFRKEESKTLTNILIEKGEKSVIRLILREYWGGGFKGGNNAFNKVVKYWKSRLPYTWDNTGNSKDIGKEKYGTKIEFSHDQLMDDLYKKYLAWKKRDMSKIWHILYKPNGYFVMKKSSRQVWFTVQEKAKSFKSYEEAWLYMNGSDYDYISSTY